MNDLRQRSTGLAAESDRLSDRKRKWDWGLTDGAIFLKDRRPHAQSVRTVRSDLSEEKMRESLPMRYSRQLALIVSSAAACVE